MNDISICSDKKYSISEANTIVQNIFYEYKNRCKDVNSHKEMQAVKAGLNWKKLKDEVIPIIKVAEYYNADYVSFSMNNNLYDGIIHIGHQQHYIECTTTINYRQIDLVYQILDSDENDSVWIPYNRDDKYLEKSVGYISKNHQILKQSEPSFKAGILNPNQPIIDIYERISEKVKKAIKNNCYQGYILVLTIDSPETACNQGLIEDIWKNRIPNNPFSNLFVFETAGDFDDFQLFMKI